MEYNERLEKAKKRVEELKGFYRHIRVYIIVNILLLLIKTDFIDFITGDVASWDPNFLHWMDLNIILTPVLWGIGLIIHGIVVYRYKFSFLRKWEERQIQKFMEEDDRTKNKYN